MKKIVHRLRRWRYRRIFHHWYAYFAKQGYSCEETYKRANEAFSWLTCFEDYREWYAREYYGIIPQNGKNFEDDVNNPC